MEAETKTGVTERFEKNRKRFVKSPFTAYFTTGEEQRAEHEKRSAKAKCGV